MKKLYSHDGLRDSLTNLAAPPLFYEELRRELARIKRTESKIVVIRMVLAKPKPELRDQKIDFQLEKDILAFGQLLAVTSRGEDICARLGEMEFLTLFHGDQFQAESKIVRIGHNWLLKEPLLKLSFSYATSIAGDTSLEILNRLDRIPLVADA